MIAPAPVYSGARTDEGDVESETCLGIGQTGERTLGVVAILVEADRSGDRAARGQSRVWSWQTLASWSLLA